MSRICPFDFFAEKPLFGLRDVSLACNSGSSISRPCSAAGLCWEFRGIQCRARGNGSPLWDGFGSSPQAAVAGCISVHFLLKWFQLGKP